MLNGLEVLQLGGRESGIDVGSWAQSPESLPGLSDKLSDAMHILDSSCCPAGLSVTPILWGWGLPAQSPQNGTSRHLFHHCLSEL